MCVCGMSVGAWTYIYRTRIPPYYSEEDEQVISHWSGHDHLTNLCGCGMGVVTMPILIFLGANLITGSSHRNVQKVDLLYW